MKILLVTGRYPWPPRRGDQLRSIQYLELLGRSHDVQLLVPAPHPSAPLPPPERANAVHLYSTSVGWRFVGLVRAMLGGLPLQSGLFWQPSLSRELRRRSSEADVVVLLLARLAGHLGDIRGRAAPAVDFVDSLSLNMERRAAFDRRFLRPLVRLEAARLARWEARLLRTAAGGAVVCERDRRAMSEGLPEEIKSRLRVVPLAVPESRQQPVVPASPSPTLVFTGNLGYFVNADALRSWLEVAWPAVRRRHPRLRLRVAGQRPSRGLRRAIEQAGGQLVVAPASMRAVLDPASIAIAPLRCGSGVPVKVLEAWAAEVPVVASRWAAEGAAGRDGVELLVADSVEEWVGAVDRLLDDEGLRRRLAAAGRSRLSREHAADVVAARLEDWLEMVAEASPDDRSRV